MSSLLRWPAPAAAGLSLLCACGSGDNAPEMSSDAHPPCTECKPTPILVNTWGGRGLLPGLFIEPSSI